MDKKILKVKISFNLFCLKHTTVFLLMVSSIYLSTEIKRRTNSKSTMTTFQRKNCSECFLNIARKTGLTEFNFFIFAATSPHLYEIRHCMDVLVLLFEKLPGQFFDSRSLDGLVLLTESLGVFFSTGNLFS